MFFFFFLKKITSTLLDSTQDSEESDQIFEGSQFSTQK